MNVDLLKEVCAVPGVSGSEKGAGAWVAEKMRPLCDRVWQDNAGNVYCVRKSAEADAPLVLLDAHLDTIGLMVKEVLEGGFLRVDPVGGFDARILPGSEMMIYGKQTIPGVVCSKPPHLMRSGEGEQAPKLEDLLIDTGYPDRQLFDLVRPGDLISFVQQADLIGRCITAPYLDDRAGVAAIIEIWERLQEKALPFDLAAAFTVQEELGLKGAKCADLKADAAIVIDVTHGSTPDEKGDRVYRTGGGTAVGCGPNVHPVLFRAALQAAGERELPVQIEVMEGNTGTNAWAYQVNGEGIPCLILSFPLKFMHTPVETMAVSDYDNLISLTTAVLERFSKEELKSLSEVKVIQGE